MPVPDCDVERCISEAVCCRVVGVLAACAAALLVSAVVRTRGTASGIPAQHAKAGAEPVGQQQERVKNELNGPGNSERTLLPTTAGAAMGSQWDRNQHVASSPVLPLSPDSSTCTAHLHACC